MQKHIEDMNSLCDSVWLLHTVMQCECDVTVCELNDTNYSVHLLLFPPPHVCLSKVNILLNLCLLSSHPFHLSSITPSVHPDLHSVSVSPSSVGSSGSSGGQMDRQIGSSASYSC